MNTLKPFVFAVGIAAATLLTEIPDTGPINWRASAVHAGTALLAALGITAYVTRAKP